MWIDKVLMCVDYQIAALENICGLVRTVHIS